MKDEISSASDTGILRCIDVNISVHWKMKWPSECSNPKLKCGVVSSSSILERDSTSLYSQESTTCVLPANC